MVKLLGIFIVIMGISVKVRLSVGGSAGGGRRKGEGTGG
jgi:hypothetical protein